MDCDFHLNLDELHGALCFYTSTMALSCGYCIVLAQNCQSDNENLFKFFYFFIFLFHLKAPFMALKDRIHKKKQIYNQKQIHNKQ